MTAMNVFSADPFSMISLTTAFAKIDYKPQLLGSLGLFTPRPSRTRSIAVERYNGVLSLIPTSEIGAPPSELTNDKRDIRDFRTNRLAKSTTLYAEELQGIRAFGSESELTQVMAEVLRRGARLRDDMELTHEHLRLGALQGIVYDADNSTVLKNWFTEFGITQPAEIDFDLDNASPAAGAVRKKCTAVVRAMQRASKGAWTLGTTVHALVGDDFFDLLITHPEVETTYLNWAAAADLRQNLSFQAFTYGGITWHNYRGTDDNTTVAVDATKAKFFPVGATDVFEVGYAPAEFGPYVNTLGRELYAIVIPDRDREAWVREEIYSYPLFICTRPEMLQRAKMT